MTDVGVLFSGLRSPGDVVPKYSAIPHLEVRRRYAAPRRATFRFSSAFWAFLRCLCHATFLRLFTRTTSIGLPRRFYRWDNSCAREAAP